MLLYGCRDARDVQDMGHAPDLQLALAPALDQVEQLTQRDTATVQRLPVGLGPQPSGAHITLADCGDDELTDERLVGG
jgi:hypothetical protein